MLNRMVMAVVAVATLGNAQNWPSFRGPGATGLGSGNPPVSFDAKSGKNLKWKTPIPGLALSSPVVWGDQVFVTTAISSDPKQFRWGLFGDVEPSDDVAPHTWKVYALDKTTGKIVWEQTAHQGAPKTKRHPKSSQASCTPVTDGKYLIAYFGSEGLFAYDLKGKLLWKKDVGIINAGWFYDPDYEWGAASSPVIYQDRVIIQADRAENSFLAAYDLKTGKELWRTARKQIPSWGTPTVVTGGKRDEIVTNGTKSINAYDPKTGKELWWMNLKNSEITVATPFVADGLVYICNGYPPVQPLIAIKPGGNGDISLKEGQTSNDNVVWSTTRGGAYMPTPIAIDGLFYVVQNNGVLSAYQAKTGQRVYQSRISSKSSAHSASPVAAGGRMYLASEDGDVFVVKAGEKFELLSTNPIGEVLMATPAIAGDLLLVRSKEHVYAFEETTKP
jgi:outer membrane protein assembly factor BamB